jgi:hypothetical protein
MLSAAGHSKQLTILDHIALQCLHLADICPGNFLHQHSVSLLTLNLVSPQFPLPRLSIAASTTPTP